MRLCRPTQAPFGGHARALHRRSSRRFKQSDHCAQESRRAQRVAAAHHPQLAGVKRMGGARSPSPFAPFHHRCARAHRGDSSKVTTASRKHAAASDGDACSNPNGRKSRPLCLPSHIPPQSSGFHGAPSTSTRVLTRQLPCDVEMQQNHGAERGTRPSIARFQGLGRHIPPLSQACSGSTAAHTASDVIIACATTKCVGGTGKRAAGEGQPQQWQRCRQSNLPLLLWRYGAAAPPISRWQPST